MKALPPFDRKAVRVARPVNESSTITYLNLENNHLECSIEKSSNKKSSTEAEPRKSSAYSLIVIC